MSLEDLSTVDVVVVVNPNIKTTNPKKRNYERVAPIKHLLINQKLLPSNFYDLIKFAIPPIKIERINEELEEDDLADRLSDLACYSRQAYILISKSISSLPIISADVVKQLTGYIEKLNDYIAENERFLRHYSSKIINSKWCLATNLFAIKCNCLLIKYKLFKSDDPYVVMETNASFKEWLHNKSDLLMYNIPISKLSQTQLFNQILLLADKWNVLLPHANILFLCKILEYRVAEIVSQTNSKTILDGVDDKHRLQFSENVYACSPQYIDDMSCFFAAFGKSKRQYNTLLKFYNMKSLDSIKKIDESTLLSSIYNPTDDIVNGFREWVADEARIIAEESLKDKIRLASINASLRAGELQIFIRNNGGVKPSNGLSVIEENRTPLQVNWWMTESIYKGIGIKYNDVFPIIDRMTMCIIFNSYCESKTKLPWSKECLILEKDFEDRLLTISGSNETYVVQTMGSYNVIHKNELYITNTIERAIITWVLLTKYRKDGVFKNAFEVWDINSVLDIINKWNQSGNKKRSEDISNNKEMVAMEIEEVGMIGFVTMPFSKNKNLY